MLTLPISNRLTLPPLMMAEPQYPLAHGKMNIDAGDLAALVAREDAQYLHLSSSACLSGMTDSRLPAELHGSLLPLGRLAEHDITPDSGEGGSTDVNQLKYHAVSVCSTVDIQDSLSTLAGYSGTEGFVADNDFPVLFAIHNTGSMTSHPEDESSPVIDPMGKMDACEFAIRGGVAAGDIRAIIVPKEYEMDACRMLSTLPSLQDKVTAFS